MTQKIDDELIQKHLQNDKAILGHLTKKDELEKKGCRYIFNNEKKILRILNHTGFFDKSLLEKIAEYKALHGKLKTELNSKNMRSNQTPLSYNNQLEMEKNLIDILLEVKKKLIKISELCELSIKTLNNQDAYSNQENYLAEDMIKEIEWIYEQKLDSLNPKKCRDIEDSLIGYYHTIRYDIDMLVKIFRMISSRMKNTIESLDVFIGQIKRKTKAGVKEWKIEFFSLESQLNNLITSYEFDIKEDKEIVKILDDMENVKKYHTMFFGELFKILKTAKESLDKDHEINKFWK